MKVREHIDLVIFDEIHIEKPRLDGHVSATLSYAMIATPKNAFQKSAPGIGLDKTPRTYAGGGGRNL